MTTKDRSENISGWVGPIVSALTLLMGLVTLWHSMDKKLDLLGQSIDAASATVAQDSKRIKTLEDFLLTKNPDLMPYVAAKRVAKRSSASAPEMVSTEHIGGDVTVHHFAMRELPGMGIAADAAPAEMPAFTKTPVAAETK